MDDFVSHVLEQVLTGGSAKGSPAVSAASPGAPPARPNYQREKAKARLLAYDLEPQGARVYARADIPVVGTPSPQPFYTVKEERGSYDDSLSGMRRALLTPSSLPARADERVSQSGLPAVAPDFGRKEGLTVRFIEKADARVARMLDIPLRGEGAVGLLHGGCCPVSYLFAAEQVLGAFPSLYGSAGWSAQPGEAFSLKLCGEAQTVRQALALFSGVLHKGGQAGGFFESASPSLLLQRHLKLSSRYPAVALQGVNFADAAVCINEYYQNNPETMVEFTTGADYLLAQGIDSEIHEAAAGFRQRLRALAKEETE